MKISFDKLARNTGVALIAASVLATTAIAPAAAGGSLSFSVSGRNAEERGIFRTALQIYSIANALEGRSGVRQTGNNNNAGLRQQGPDNLGIVHQDGNGHQGSLQQTGGGNSHGLFQFGKNTNAHVTQRGNGQTGATFVFGW